MASRQHDLKLYLEHINPDTKAEVSSDLTALRGDSGADMLWSLQWVRTHGNEPPIVVFVKHFDVSHQTLAGLGHFYVHRHMRVMDLALMINEKMKYPSNTPLKIYEVRKNAPETVDLQSRC